MPTPTKVTKITVQIKCNAYTCGRCQFLRPLDAYCTAEPMKRKLEKVRGTIFKFNRSQVCIDNEYDTGDGK